MLLNLQLIGRCHRIYNILQHHGTLWATNYTLHPRSFWWWYMLRNGHHQNPHGVPAICSMFLLWLYNIKICCLGPCNIILPIVKGFVCRANLYFLMLVKILGIYIMSTNNPWPLPTILVIIETMLHLWFNQVPLLVL